MHTTIRYSTYTPSLKSLFYSGIMPGVYLEDLTVSLETYMLITLDLSLQSSFEFSNSDFWASKKVREKILV